MAIKVEASGKEVLDIVDRVGKGLEWLGSKQMYVWRTEYTMEKLKKARNELEDMIKTAVETMEDAQLNGWSLKGTATGWVREALVFISFADGVIVMFEEQYGDPTHATRIAHCLCETLSRRSLNAQAIMRLNNILEHKDAGKVIATGDFEDVAFNRTTAGVHPERTTHSLHDRLAALVAPTAAKTQPLPASISKEEAASELEKIQLSGFTKYSAFARSQSHASVPVLIRVNAPRYTQRFRTPIDLVLVLDVSGSMGDRTRGEQMKLGSMFVVHNMEANDGLSVVTFNNNAQLLLPLTKMSNQAKSNANQLITSLQWRGGTNIQHAMELAYQTLRCRPDEDRVGIILLFTDGMQTNGDARRLTSTEEYPTYTIGLGGEHDPHLMFSIASSGHGTYSFVNDEDSKSLRDAMALYIGGFTSIVAQDMEICIRSAHQDVRMVDIMSGGYKHSVVDGGKLGAITVNDIFAGEEKNFIVYVNVPEEETVIFGGTPRTKLLTVTASYYCPFTRVNVHTDIIEISVDRPGQVRGPARNIVVEVASEVIRAKFFTTVEMLLAMRNIPTGMEPPEYVNTELVKLRYSIHDTEEAKVAMDRWEDLISDLDVMQSGQQGMMDYEKTLPYMLSWLSSHLWQRAATLGSTSKSKWFSFRTTRMRNMIDSVESAPIVFT